MPHRATRSTRVGQEAEAPRAHRTKSPYHHGFHGKEQARQGEQAQDWLVGINSSKLCGIEAVLVLCNLALSGLQWKSLVDQRAYERGRSLSRD